MWWERFSISPPDREDFTILASQVWSCEATLCESSHQISLACCTPSLSLASSQGL